MKKDGGEFDQFTGATITPRAVVRAVRLALTFFQKHGKELAAEKDYLPESASSIEQPQAEQSNNMQQEGIAHGE